MDSSLAQRQLPHLRARAALPGSLMRGQLTRFPAAHVRVGDTVVLRNPDGEIARGKVTEIKKCSSGHILWRTDPETRFGPGWIFLGCHMPDELIEVL